MKWVVSAAAAAAVLVFVGSASADATFSPTVHLAAPDASFSSTYDPNAIAVSPGGGTLYVLDTYSNHEQVHEYSTSDGSYLRSFGSDGSGNGQFINPDAIATDPSGNVFVDDSGNHRIQELSASGDYIGAVSASYLYYSTSIAVDGSGHVWVVSSQGGSSNALDEYSYDGSGNFTHVRTVDLDPAQPSGAATDPSGNVWVSVYSSSTSSYRVDEYSSAGDLLRTTGAISRFDSGEFAVDGYDHLYACVSGTGLEVLAFDWTRIGTVTSSPRSCEVALGPGGTVYELDDGAYSSTDSGILGFSRDQTAFPPTAATGTAGVTDATATLEGTVDPAGADTTYRFDYGTDTSYGSATTDQQVTTGSGPTDVRASIAESALKPSTTYHFRLEATNSAGTTDGHDATFTTPPAVTDGWQFNPTTLETNAEADAAVARDAAGDVLVAWARYEADGYPHYVAATRAAGSGQWRVSQDLDTSYNGGPYITAAFDSNGTAVVAWVHNDDRNAQYVSTAHLGNLTSGTWTVDGPVSGTAVYTDEIALAAGANGTSIASWYDETSNSIQAAVRSGGAWAAPATLDAFQSVLSSEPQAAVVDGSGNGYVAYRGPNGMEVNRYDATNGWSLTPENVYVSGNSEVSPQLGVDSSGVATLVWEDMPNVLGAKGTLETATRASGGNGSWSSVSALTDNTAEGATTPSLAEDSGGDAIVAYQSALGARYLTRTGGTWSSPATLDSSGGDPVAGIDAQGDTLVMWWDAGMKAASMAVGGSFGASVLLDPAAVGYQSETGLAVGPDGTASAVWGSGQNGTNVETMDRIPGSGGSSGSGAGATTGAADGIGLTSAVLHGAVDPNGADTTWHFEYGPTTSYGSQSPATDGTVTSADGVTAVTGNLSGLTPFTTYHYRLVATNANGTTDGADETFFTTAVPRVSSLSSTSGPGAGGATVTITGQNLTGATSVHFGDATASFEVVSATVITAETPAHAAGTVDVTVTTPGGTSATSTDDRYTFVGPVISWATPNPAPAAGGPALIGGVNLSHATVRVAGQTAQVVKNTATSILFQLPAGQSDTAVTVRTSKGSASTTYRRYTYPVINTISPNHGRDIGGYTATITGTNLASGEAVTFGSVTAALVAQSATEGTVTVPAGSGTEQVTIANGSDEAPAGSQLSVYFAYEPQYCAQGDRSCEFAAWAQAGINLASTPISNYQAEDRTTDQETGADPTGVSNENWWCQFETGPECQALAGGPVSAHVSHSLVGSNGGASAQAEPFGSALDLSAEAQGNAAQNSDGSFVDASGYTDNFADATGQTIAEDTWVLDQQPTQPVRVYVAISTSTRAVVSSSDQSPWDSDAHAGWQLFVGSWTYLLASGYEHYYATYDADHGISRFVDSSTLTVNGKEVPGGATTTLLIPYTVSPSDWNWITVMTTLAGEAKVACNNGSLCNGAAAATIDPVVISTDPRYRVESKAPAAAAGAPLISSSSALSLRRGKPLVLSGAGFGATGGHVLFTEGKRTIRAAAGAWSDTRVKVKLPKSLALGSLYVRLRTSKGSVSNPVPLTVQGRVAAPLLWQVRPGAGRAGARITIVGEHLKNAHSVLFGRKRARIVHRGASSLEVVVPRGHGVVDVSVVGPGGPSARTTGDLFRYR